ncbi:DUF6115 domain-containing protein [Lachnospiraceae bacterium 29-84]
MATIEIVLVVIGTVMMVASFFITEKLTNKELDKISELSTEEMQRILARSLQEAQTKITQMVDQLVEQSIDKSMEVVERALDKETNEKMRAITEYSDTVLESIHKTHNEVMFLYSMLNDKHSELTSYAGNLAQLAIHLEELQEGVQKTVDASGALPKDFQAAPAPEDGSGKEEALKEEPEPAASETEAPGGKENHNEDILAMYQKGKDAVEIAKELGLGIGEVRLVIGLFREEDK